MKAAIASSKKDSVSWSSTVESQQALPDGDDDDDDDDEYDYDDDDDDDSL